MAKPERSIPPRLVAEPLRRAKRLAEQMARVLDKEEVSDAAMAVARLIPESMRSLAAQQNAIQTAVLPGLAIRHFQPGVGNGMTATMMFGKAHAPGLHNALRLDLNKEFEEPRSDSLKYFFVVLMLFALLIFAVSQMVGLERSLG